MIYIVVKSGWDEYEIFGIYDDRELAERRMAKVNEGEPLERRACIDEFPLNKPLDPYSVRPNEAVEEP